MIGGKLLAEGGYGCVFTPNDVWIKTGKIRNFDKNVFTLLESMGPRGLHTENANECFGGRHAVLKQF